MPDTHNISHKHSDLNTFRIFRPLPFWDFTFYVLGNLFLFEIIFAIAYLPRIMFIISIILVIKYKLFLKLYFYISTIIMISCTLFAPSLSVAILSEYTLLESGIFVIKLVPFILLCYFTSTLYLLPKLKEQINLMLLILPIATLSVVLAIYVPLDLILLF